MSKPYSTIIIDDEPPAREGLYNLLKEFPETFQVIEMAKNGTEAKEKIAKHKPDVIFLDIEMPGCTGFELLEKLETIPLVVFCTAYDQYSLKAFETNSIDYLVKPVKLERLKKTAQKLKSLNNKMSSQHLLEVIKEVSLEKNKQKMNSITIKKGDRIIFVKLEEVSHFEADANYVSIFTATGIHLSELSLAHLEQKLPTNFLRVHRGIIINTNFVAEVQKYFNCRFIISLTNKSKTTITSGRSYNEQIKNWMGV